MEICNRSHVFRARFSLAFWSQQTFLPPSWRFRKAITTSIFPSQSLQCNRVHGHGVSTCVRVWWYSSLSILSPPFKFPRQPIPFFHFIETVVINLQLGASLIPATTNIFAHPYSAIRSRVGLEQTGNTFESCAPLRKHAETWKWQRRVNVCAMTDRCEREDRKNIRRLEGRTE